MKYEYWFGTLPGISAARKFAIRTAVPSAAVLYKTKEFHTLGICLKEKEILAIQDGQKRCDKEILNRNLEELHRKQIYFLRRGTKEYPKRLSNISAPPYLLYVKGKLPEEEMPAAAIVGARSCTAYGRQSAENFAVSLSRHGVLLVSGMALGIDGAAQRGALKAGGKTIAVLGCGVDLCYPREHIGLYQDILDTGGAIISEYPPGTPPLPQNFPARNRIISGLSDVVLVMEARQKSGSLITADMALEQGKDVYALPGPISSSLSRGCHQLIQQGAGILLSPEELLEELEFGSRNLYGKIKETKIKLESHLDLVYSCLGFCQKGLQQIVEETELPVQTVIGALTDLTLQGYAEEISKNYYVKCI